MRVGQVRRRDAVEPAIIDAYRRVGAEVWQISGVGAPDLLVRYQRRVYGFEVKSEDGARTPAQEKSQWPIIRNVEEALAGIGILPRGRNQSWRNGANRSPAPAQSGNNDRSNDNGDEKSDSRSRNRSGGDSPG